MIIKSFIIKLLNGQNEIVKMGIDVPTKADALYCANTLKASIEAIMRVNNRLCGWSGVVNLKIVIEDYKA